LQSEQTQKTELQHINVGVYLHSTETSSFPDKIQVFFNEMVLMRQRCAKTTISQSYSTLQQYENHLTGSEGTGNIQNPDTGSLSPV